jgi:Tfp pilus assembly protein PilF
MPHLPNVAALLLIAASLLAVQTPAPKREDAYRANNLGVAYLEQYNYEQAAASFRRALEIDSGLTLARINLAIALLYVPDHAAAAKEAAAALQQQPDAPQAHYVLGLVARSENRPEDGIAAFKRVLSADPRDVGALVNLGQLLMQNRQYAEAAALFRTAVEAEPYHVTATYNLAVALTRSGNTAEGQKLTQRFQTLRESGYGTTFSNNYLEQGRFAEALISTGAEPDLVNTATPAVEFVESRTIAAPAKADTGAPQNSDTGSGSMTLADLDRDDDLDLIDVTKGVVRVSLNEKGQFTDATSKLGIASSGATAVLVGDYDNDERPDLFVIGSSPGAHALYHQGADGRFENRTAAAKLPAPSATLRAGAFADIDHDGDVDLFLTGGSNQLLRNNGDGTFADVTAEAKLGAVEGLQAQAVVPTDYDNRRDLDLIVVGSGHAPVLFRNMRDGTFQDAAKEAALPGGVTFISVAAGDVNKDGFVDLFLGRQDAVGTLLLNERGASFRAAEGGPAPTNAVTSQFIDYDNDGLLDLVTLSTTGRGSVFRNLGRTWAEVTTTAFKTINPPEEPVASSASTASSASSASAASSAASSAKSVRGGFVSFVAGDLDRDGDTDLIVKARGGAMAVLDNQGGNKNASVRVRLTGRVSNRSGIGSKVEVRAGSLWQRLELTSTSPAIAPADISFGLGPRAQADVVRVLWPAGIVQAEPLADANAKTTGAKAQSLAFTELDRKPSSCPYLYTWNGENFEFVTDFMGGGEMGYLHAPGVRSVPDPVEYVRIRGDQLKPRDGRYELRVTNELEEALFVDRLRLIAIAHPPEVEVHPNEGLFAPPFPEHELMIARDVKPAATVFDHAGRDVTARAAARDRQFVDDLPIEKIRGYARPHTLTIDMGGAEGCAAPDLLLLTGWTDYAFSSDNVAAHQAGLAMQPPSLAVRDNTGRWQTVTDNIGIPVGRPQTIVVDLSDKWMSASREVRISTSMRIYWDQIQVGSRDRGLTLPGALGAAGRIISTTLDPISANLRWRGFSAEATKEEPFTYDYARVSTTSPWKVMPGRYTREGDVRELLRATDDMFVVSRPGDEIALSFDASALPPLPAGWTRTFLLYSDGYSKEMDLNSASPDQAWPLPFHRMTTYPYAAPERFPLTDAHRAYIERYNTRVVHRSVPVVPAAPVEP